jgi:hypothetical protein
MLTFLDTGVLERSVDDRLRVEPLPPDLMTRGLHKFGKFCVTLCALNRVDHDVRLAVMRRWHGCFSRVRAGRDNHIAPIISVNADNNASFPGEIFQDVNGSRSKTALAEVSGKVRIRWTSTPLCRYLLKKSKKAISGGVCHC